MNAKSSSGATAFHGAIDRMNQSGEYNLEMLYRAASRFPNEPRFHTVLGLTLFHKGMSIVGAVIALRQARQALMLKAETNPGNPEIFHELELLERDLAEAEAALPA